MLSSDAELMAAPMVHPARFKNPVAKDAVANCSFPEGVIVSTSRMSVSATRSLEMTTARFFHSLDPTRGR